MEATKSSHVSFDRSMRQQCLRATAAKCIAIIDSFIRGGNFRSYLKVVSLTALKHSIEKSRVMELPKL